MAQNHETKPPRRVGMHIYVLPNLLTTMNMFFGFFSIIYAIYGDFALSAYAIVVAAVFDLLDGRVARMTHATSRFGAEYDSLSDLVSFCMAPALLLFLWSLQPFERVGWLASFFYLACGALRLARFNVQSGSIEKGYFQGLPTPMAAGIVASSVLAFDDLELDAAHSRILLAMTFLLGFVMVSNFRYRSFKDLDLRHRLPFRYLVVGVFLIAMIAIRPESALFVMFLSYAILGAVFGIWRLRVKRPRFGRPYSPAPDEDLHEEIEDENA
jgi:CDP-diacylglycerol--serine O-phosphatidyltransferase